MAPQIFYLFFRIYSFTAAEGDGFPSGRHEHPNGGTQGSQRWRRWAPLPRRAREIPPKAGVREHVSKFLTYFSVSNLLIYLLIFRLVHL